ncbi:hypothetical protein ACNRWW_14065 [Metabacillus sp. HB246100]
MLFKSTKYPQLRVSDLGVKFKDGEYETTDKKKITGLKKLSDIGVEAVESSEPPQEPGQDPKE